MSYGDLIGKLANPSDLVSKQRRLQYTTSSTVAANNGYLRLAIPREGPNTFLDCSTIRMRYTLTLSSTDANICVDAQYAYPFEHIKVSSGSTTLMETTRACLLMNMLFLANAQSTLNPYEQSLVGNGTLQQRQVWGQSAHEYLIECHPPESVINRPGLMQLQDLPDLLLEFYSCNSTQFLYSPAGDTAASFSLSSIELLYEVVSSPSLGAYFRSNGMSYSCKNFDVREYTVSSGLTTYTMQLSSSYTSLDGVWVVSRGSTVDNSVSNVNKQSTWNANSLSSLQASVNGFFWFDEPIASFPQLYRLLSDLDPKILSSAFIASGYTSNTFLLGINWSATPSRFAGEFKAGMMTSAQNQPVALIFTLGSSLGSAQTFTAFLQSTVDVIVDPSKPGRDIQVRR